MSAFFTLHRDLPREGPGLPEDVAWAAQACDLPADGMMCDVACGPGADVAALLQAAPEGFVTGIDKQAHFIAAARQAHKGNDRVRFEEGDMAKLPAVYDLIWCAGALYFLGVGSGLRGWAKHLKKGGAIAFSYPCYFAPHPSQAAVAFWEGEGDIPTKAQLATQIGMAGFHLMAARPLTDAAWEAYYAPMAARIEQLEAKGDPELADVLDAGRAEIAGWRAARAETGYMLCVVRPA